ncbi:hypothetical protein GH714_033993 [Hevea brasiliensis]|uniref:U2A'/phosphoprotein 32 family A C-terminal domain-containing protein n=1 Tax=Hevea brasiliensis TaxID=3981 RepID=A0A6A6LP51_HEVBR|nr:hypothetical protein GH714_033993 [Hevea brasiliensis]
MDEIWERAVETALDGQTDHAAARTLTLDGAVKCVQGRLPPPTLLEKFENLQQLSIANIGVSSLEQFPRLRNLQKLILSDNRIAGGLEFLVEAGLDSLRDLDLMKKILVQDIGSARGQAEVHDAGGSSDMELANEEDDHEGEEEVEDDEVQAVSSSSHLKRKKDEDLDLDEDDDDDDDGEDDEEDDDVVEYSRSSKKQR